MAPRKRLGQLLTEMGVVDEHQLQSALGHQRQWGGKLGNILVQKGFCKEADVVRVLSQHLGMPVVKLAEVKIDPRAYKLVTRQVAEKLRVFPIELSGSGRGEVVTIAMSEPTDLSVVDQLSFHTGKRIKPVLTGESEITQAIALHYGEPPKAPEQGKPGQVLPPIARQSSAGQGPRVPPVMPVTGSTRPPLPPIPPPVMSPGIGQATPAFGSRVATIPPPAIHPAGKTAPFAPVRAPVPYIPPPIPARPQSAQPGASAALDEIEPMDLESTLPSLAPFTRAEQQAGPPQVQALDLEPDSLPDDAPMPGLEPIAASTGSESDQEGEAMLDSGGSPDEQMAGLEPIAALTDSEQEAPAEALPLEGSAGAAAEPEGDLPIERNATPEGSWDEAAAAPPPAEASWDAAAAGGWQAAAQAPVPAAPPAAAAAAAPGWDQAPPPQVAPDNPFGEARDWSSAAAEEEHAAAAAAAAVEAAHAEVEPLEEEPADELPADAIMGTAEELPADAIVGTADEAEAAAEEHPAAEAAPAEAHAEAAGDLFADAAGSEAFPHNTPPEAYPAGAHPAAEEQQASSLEAPAWGTEAPADPWAAAIAEHVGEEPAAGEATERVDLASGPPVEEAHAALEEHTADVDAAQAGGVEAPPTEADSPEAHATDEHAAEAPATEAHATEEHATEAHATEEHATEAHATEEAAAAPVESAEYEDVPVEPAEIPVEHEEAPAAYAEAPAAAEAEPAAEQEVPGAAESGGHGAPAAVVDEDHGLVAADDAHAAEEATEAAAPDAWGEVADPLAAREQETAASGEKPAAEAAPAEAANEAPAETSVEPVGEAAAEAASEAAPADEGVEAPAAWGDAVADVQPEAPAWGEGAQPAAEPPAEADAAPAATVDELHAALEEPVAAVEEQAAPAVEAGPAEELAHAEAADPADAAAVAEAELASTDGAGHDELHAVSEEAAPAPAEEVAAEPPAGHPTIVAADSADGTGGEPVHSIEEPGVFEEPPQAEEAAAELGAVSEELAAPEPAAAEESAGWDEAASAAVDPHAGEEPAGDAEAFIAAAGDEVAPGELHTADEAHAEIPAGAEAAGAPQDAAHEAAGTEVFTDDVDVSVEHEPAEGEELGLPGWVAPPPEVQPEGAGWIGQALAETTALSGTDLETLAAIGVDPHDGVGALRILAGLLRALERQQVIDLGELAHDLRAQRESAAANLAPAAEAVPAGEAPDSVAPEGEANGAPAEEAPAAAAATEAAPESH